MSEPRVVTPEEARGWIDSDYWEGEPQQIDLAHTVAAEPDRIRAAVVKALLPIRRHAEASAITARALGRSEDERRWLDLLALVERGEVSQ